MHQITDPLWPISYSSTDVGIGFELDGGILTQRPTTMQFVDTENDIVGPATAIADEFSPFVVDP